MTSMFKGAATAVAALTVALAPAALAGTAATQAGQSGAAKAKTTRPMGANAGKSHGSMSMGQHNKSMHQAHRAKIRKVQHALDQHGYNVKTDGLWGPQTRKAVTQFQKRQGLKATGRLNHKTMQALGVTH